MGNSKYGLSSLAKYALLLGSVLLAGCASFDHDWKKAAKQSTPPDDLQGRWQGGWGVSSPGRTMAFTAPASMPGMARC
jgi:hypothetical protein